MPSFDITPTPHEEAIALIRGKAVVTRDVFDGLLPELRGRAFTVTGIEDANTLQRIRDTIADLPQGSVWKDVKAGVADELKPFLGDGAERRAELLLRTHAFQAFQASNWRVAQADADTTHLQYLATEDDRVRDSHLALNGLILPKDDPFWDTHLPPWDWGCRCRIRPMNPDFVAEAKAEDANRAPEDKLVMEGPALERLRDGQLQRDGRTFDVTPPSQTDRENGYSWHPDNLRIPVAELQQRYDAPTWSAFESQMKAAKLADGVSAWSWLQGSTLPQIAKRMEAPPRGVPSVINPSPTAPRTPFEFADRRAAAIRAADSGTASQQARALAEQNWKPAPLDPERVALEKKRVLKQMQEAIVPATSGGEKLPTPPPQFAHAVAQAEAERHSYQDAVAEIIARQDLYYQQNPNALEAIRAWAGREIMKLKAQGGRASGARFT